MCHSAEKIPAKTGMPDHTSLHIFLHITYRANIGTTRRYTVGALVFPQVPRGTLKGLHSKKNWIYSPKVVVGFEIFEIAQKKKLPLQSI